MRTLFTDYIAHGGARTALYAALLASGRGIAYTNSADVHQLRRMPVLAD